MMSLPRRFALGAILALCATAGRADALSDDKKQALADFVVAYRLAELWPRTVPKIARDSLPRLEDAIHADLDADADAHRFPSHEAVVAAQRRVEGLLPQGRREFEVALQAFDADDLAAYTAFSIYAKYFETAEIRAMTAFFGSDTGTKLSTMAPTLLAERRRPGAGDVMQRHFSDAEIREITTFWESPVGQKMNSTAEQVREEMNRHFIERSEPALRAVARRLATLAEQEPAAAADAASVPVPAR